MRLSLTASSICIILLPICIIMDITTPDLFYSRLVYCNQIALNKKNKVAREKAPLRGKG